MMNRRQFLGSTLAAGSLALAGRQGGGDEPASRPRSPVDQVTLGKTGIKLSFVGMGTGSVGVNHASNQTRLGQPAFTKLVRYCFDKGITYFDTADQYGSHEFLKVALKGVPREKLFIQTKTRAMTAADARKDLDRFRRELGMDYMDTLLMHCMQKGVWPTDLRPVMDVLSEAKQKGVIRAHGVSCHGIAPLRAAAKTDWVEVDLARINPTGTRMDSSPDEVASVLEEMHLAGKGIIGMKIFGEGTYKKPEQRDASLRFVTKLGTVNAIVIGLESIAQVDDMLARVQAALNA